MQVVETNYLNANTHSNISDIALLLSCHSTKKNYYWVANKKDCGLTSHKESRMEKANNNPHC
jgi:hypothetical protein